MMISAGFREIAALKTVSDREDRPPRQWTKRISPLVAAKGYRGVSLTRSIEPPSRFQHIRIGAVRGMAVGSAQKKLSKIYSAIDNMRILVKIDG